MRACMDMAERPPCTHARNVPSTRPSWGIIGHRRRHGPSSAIADGMDHHRQSPTACLWHGYGRAGTHNDRLGESSPMVRRACPTDASARVHARGGLDIGWRRRPPCAHARSVSPTPPISGGRACLRARGRRLRSAMADRPGGLPICASGRHRNRVHGARLFSNPRSTPTADARGPVSI